MLTRLFFYAACLGVIATALNCSVAPDRRDDCGYSGIDQTKCEAQGCCWSPVNPNPDNAPWCFHDGNAPSPSPPSPPAPGNGSFSPAEIALMKSFFLANINIEGSGGVVASPDKGTKGGSYYFHWMRDGAITMDAVQTLLGSDHSSVASYVKWVQRAQAATSPNSIDVRGEPKFNLPDGSVFSGGWCRPQNDGAGLRARALGHYALHLIANGSSSEAQNTLWPMLTKDCDYVQLTWQDFGKTCDLWEEIRGELFFTLAVQRKGLLMCVLVGEQLKVSDDKLAGYKSTAGQIFDTAAKHWNGQFVQESSSRRKDSATILGILYGSGDGHDLWPITDAKITSTVSVLNGVFRSMFAINGKDDAAGIPGILWGRYEGDGYAGGNPWILNTGGLADVYYRQAAAVWRAAKQQTLGQDGPVLGSEDVAALMQAVSPRRVGSLRELALALAALGDGVMTRIRTHVAPLGFHLPEQVDRSNGAFANARDLTWSYGSVLLADHSRQQFALLSSGAQL